MCVCVCVLITLSLICLGSFGIRAPSRRGEVRLCATDCYEECCPVIPVHMSLFVCSHDLKILHLFHALRLFACHGKLLENCGFILFFNQMKKLYLHLKVTISSLGAL